MLSYSSLYPVGNRLVCRAAYVPGYLYIYIFVYLSIYVSIYLPAYLPITESDIYAFSGQNTSRQCRIPQKNNFLFFYTNSFWIFQDLGGIQKHSVLRLVFADKSVTRCTVTTDKMPAFKDSFRQYLISLNKSIQSGDRYSCRLG